MFFNLGQVENPFCNIAEDSCNNSEPSKLIWPLNLKGYEWCKQAECRLGFVCLCSFYKCMSREDGREEQNY